MNLKNLFAKLSLIVVLLTMFAASTFAQTYVSNTNGNDVTGTGQDVGTGIPYKTIAYAITKTADGGTIIIDADVYNEAGPIDLTGGGAGKNLTFQARTFNGLSTLTVTNGIAVGVAKTVNLGVSGVAFKTGIVNLTAGTLNITTANLIVSSGGTITRTAGTINVNPTTTNVNVTYNGTADVSAGGELPASLGNGTLTVSITAGKTLTAASTLAFTDAGKIVVNTGNVNFGAVNFAFAAAPAANPIYATNTGNTVTFSGDVTFSSTIGAVSAIELLNDDTGTLAFAGSIVNNTSSGTSKITIALTNNIAASGKISLAGGTVNGVVTNAAGKTLELTGSATFSGTTLTNAGTLKLNGNQLTLSGTNALGNAGNIISATASTVGSGVLNITGTVTLTGAGELPNVNVGSGGSLILPNATVPAYGTFTLGSSAAGALTFNAGGGTLEIYGSSFNRTDNTPANVTAGAGTLSFRGALAQAFTPGGSLVLFNLLVNKTASTVVSLGSSVAVSNDLTITSGTLDVGNYNLNMTGAGTFTNSGQAYSSTNIGYVAFLGAGGTVTGSGTFGNILVNVTPAASVVNTLGAAINFSGILFINQGTFNVIAATTMTFSGALVANPTVKINTTAANLSAFTRVGTVTYAVNVNLYYFGANNFAAAAEWNGTPTKLNDVTIATDGGTTVTGFNGASTINGTLSVAGNTTLAQGANVYTLAGDAKTHSIVGSVTGGTLLETGAGSALNGTTSTTAGFNGAVNNLSFEPAANGATFTSSNLKTIGGNLVIADVSTKTGASATIVMNPTTSTLSGSLSMGAGVAATASVTVNGSTTSVFTGNVVLTAGNLTLTRGGNSVVNGGGVTLTAGTLTLGSNLTVTGTTSQVAGNIAAGGFKYKQLGVASNYTRTGAGTFTNGTLSLDATTAAITLTPGATFVVPNLEAIGTANGVSVTAAMEVSNSLLLDNAGTFAQTGVLTVSGPIVTITNDAGAFTGAMTLTDSPTVTLGQNYTIPTLTINSAGTATVTTSVTPVAAQTLTVNTLFTNTAGTLAMGIHHLLINGAGAFTFTAGAITQTSGILTWGGAGAVTIPATGFAIDNLTILTATTVGTNAFTVNKALVLSNTLTTSADGKLTLGDGCLVTRTDDAMKLVKVPTFGANTDLKYMTFTGAVDINSDKEMPASVRNLSVLTSANGVVLTANVTITGTLSLASYLKQLTNSKVITMADGSTLELKALGTTVLDKDLTKAGAMNLIYNGAATTTTRELGTATSGAYAAFPGNVTVKAAVANLTNTTTWNGSFTFDGGNFDLAGLATGVGGSLATTTNGGTFVNTGAAAFLNFTGATNTNLALNATWVVPASIKFRLNKTNNTNTVALSGGNLDFSTANTKLYFANGILTTGTAVVILRHDDDGVGNPLQGFDRSGVTGTNISHVSGNVRKYLDATGLTYGHSKAVAMTRVEFPVGSSLYKPMAFQFNTLPTSNFNLTVSEVEASPGGTNGFSNPPLMSGSLQLANYPNFYWLVTSDLTLQPQVVYDIEAEAYGYGPANYPEGIQNVRFLRRFDTDINNPWILQGGLGYDNSTNVDHAKIIVRSAQGAISTQGARFTYSQAAKAPIVATASAAVTVAENATLTVAWTKTSQNIGGSVTFGTTPVWTATAPAVVPTNAVFDAAAGTLTWTPTYTQSGVYTIKVTATDGTLSSDNTVTITVTDAPRPLVFATATTTVNPATATVKNNSQLALTYSATDPDGGTVTYTMTIAPAPSVAPVLVAATGAFTWTPAYADVKVAPYVVTVTATAGAKTLATVTNITVTGRALRGDANLDLSVNALDAPVILKHVVGSAVITDAEALWAADANADGVVGALDAAWDLYYAVNGAFPIAKSVAAAGTVEFGKFVNNKGTYNLPVNLQNTRGVQSVYTEVALGSDVDYKGVSTNLPEGWQVASNFENGVLKIAMAGLTPLTDGSIANINIALKSQDAVASVTGKVMMNDEVSASMQAKVREIPSNFSLSQNYPNPFNPTTNIRYAISADTRVGLVIYNILGQAVRTLVNADQEAGFYTATWDGTNDFGSKVASGVYIYRITAGNFVSTIKMNLMK